MHRRGEQNPVGLEIEEIALRSSPSPPPISLPLSPFPGMVPAPQYTYNKPGQVKLKPREG